MNTALRPATLEDQPTLVDFIQTMAAESEGIRLEDAILQQGVFAVFSHPERGRYWLLEAEDGSPVAMCLVTPEWSDWNNRNYWWIQSVYIPPEARGKGLWETMLTGLEAHAHEAGVTELRLYVDTQNARAIRAYEKSGFAPPHYVVMQKPIPLP